MFINANITNWYTETSLDKITKISFRNVKHKYIINISIIRDHVHIYLKFLGVRFHSKRKVITDSLEFDWLFIYIKWIVYSKSSEVNIFIRNWKINLNIFILIAWNLFRSYDVEICSELEWDIHPCNFECQYFHYCFQWKYCHLVWMRYHSEKSRILIIFREALIITSLYTYHYYFFH